MHRGLILYLLCEFVIFIIRFLFEEVEQVFESLLHVFWFSLAISGANKTKGHLEKQKSFMNRLLTKTVESADLPSLWTARLADSRLAPTIVKKIR